MTIYEAISKAVEGGYKVSSHEHTSQERLVFPFSLQEFCMKSIFDDPSFWQALGKSMGWIKTDCDACCENNLGSQDEWQYEWHSFIDTLASGGTAEDYFAKLK